ncbi:hypothetical protein [Amycolatopsis rubida]|nr:hypothetical protein [Amycolatopsis rubida]
MNPLFDVVIEQPGVMYWEDPEDNDCWQARQLGAGVYPARLVTTDLRELGADDDLTPTVGRPYFAISDVPAIVVDGWPIDLERGTEVVHRVWLYDYLVRDGAEIWGFKVDESLDPRRHLVGFLSKRESTSVRGS